MLCPFCRHLDTQVKDSRACEDNAAIRRRRICTKCNGRFTTIERIQLRDLWVQKKDGTLIPFDREKLSRSVFIALHKRPFERIQVDAILNSIVRQLETSGETEIPSRLIGEMVMESLAEIDHVAYVRFASVYQNFQWPKDFADFVKSMKAKGESIKGL
jgi:transcriptional repressor NrdR